jgi:arylsulfatase A
MSPLRFLCALLLVSLAVSCTATLEKPVPPNVVVILADDLGIGDLQSYNLDSKIPTPNLDALAAAGMRFTDAHSPSGVCTPTRYGLLTGRYSWRTRLKSGVLWGEDTNLIDVDRMTVADMMRGAGYTTAVFGKWHLGLGAPADGIPVEESKTDWQQPLVPGPLEHGFDEFFGIPASLDMEPYLYVRGSFPEQQPTEHVEASAQARVGGGGFWRAGPIAPDFRHIEVLPRVVDEATAFIQRQAAAQNSDDDRKPFFVYLPLPAPHKPWLPTEPFRGRSDAGPYGDFVTMVDQEVGRVLTALDELGITDNTLVIFTSDNGAQWVPSDIEQYTHQANANWRGQKGDVHDGGHRIPFLARWPGHIAAGDVRDELLGLTDIQATLAGLLNLDLPPNAAEDSVDQSPLLLGLSSSPPRQDIIHHSQHGMFSLRKDNWKLIVGRGSGGFTNPQFIEPAAGEPAGQLYDMAVDPAETNNLYLGNPEKVDELMALLAGYRVGGSSR